MSTDGSVIESDTFQLMQFVWKTRYRTLFCLSVIIAYLSFKNGPKLGLFYVHFQSFQLNITMLQQNVKKIHPVYGAWIRPHNLLITSLLT